jgi:hypothetical protein
MTTPATKRAYFSLSEDEDTYDALFQAAEVERDVMEAIANEKRDCEYATIDWACATCCASTKIYGQFYRFDSDGRIKNVYCGVHFPDFDDSGDCQ